MNPYTHLPYHEAKKLIALYYLKGGCHGRTIPKKRRRKTPAWIYLDENKRTWNYGLIEDVITIESQEEDEMEDENEPIWYN